MFQLLLMSLEMDFSSLVASSMLDLMGRVFLALLCDYVLRMLLIMLQFYGLKV